MILQLHHQHQDGRRDLIAQRELTVETLTTQDVGAWLRDVGERHPLPKGCHWLMIAETSDNFLRAGGVFEVEVREPRDIVKFTER